MRVRLFRDFTGRLTNEQWIRAGEYDSGDPALMGLADYLVGTSEAIEIEDKTPFAFPDEDVASPVTKKPAGRPPAKK